MQPASLTELKGGLIVRDDAIALACELELRGHQMRAASGALHVTRQSELTADDRARITKLKAHLLAIADYVQRGRGDA